VFIHWVIFRKGQKTTADYKIGGEQLFFPNAGQEGYDLPFRNERSDAIVASSACSRE